MARFESRWTANRVRVHGGPVVNSDERGELVDGLEPVVLLGLELCENETDPVMPVSQDVNLKEHNGLVDRSGPGATQSMTEPSALLTLKTDWMENAALGPVGPDGYLSGRDEAGDRSRQPQEVGPTGRSGQTRGETSPITRWALKYYWPDRWK